MDGPLLKKATSGSDDPGRQMATTVTEPHGVVIETHMHVLECRSLEIDAGRFGDEEVQEINYDDTTSTLIPRIVDELEAGRGGSTNGQIPGVTMPAVDIVF